jgi:hypothetical protein
MVQYKDYLIVGRALRVHPNSPDCWRSQGDVFTNTPKGTIHITHVEGAIFESEQTAEVQGIEICKRWVDENPNATDDL